MAQVVQNLNQFNQTALVGQPDWTANQNIVSVKIYASSSGGAGLVAGIPIKYVDTAGDMPVVDICSGVTDTPIGVLIHRMKGDLFAAGQIVEAALGGSTIFMQTSAAIARGARVQCDPTTSSTYPTVATLTSLGTNASLGINIDKPAATGALTRIYIEPKDPNLSAY